MRTLADCADAIAEIARLGHVALVVLEPDDDWKDALRVSGYGGELVSAMPLGMSRRLSCADPITEHWLARSNRGEPPHRVFVVMRDNSLLVNLTPGRAPRLEPGSST